MNATTGDYQTADRMAVKFRAVPLPDLNGRSVLDVGCDHGAWCWRALDLGASRVLGLDRGRPVPGEGFVNLAERNRNRQVKGAAFREFELGKQWHDFGRHDVVLMLNVYHHVYQVTADHAPIWYWLWRHTGQTLLWEAPTSKDDGVAAQHVDHPYHRADILAAAEQWFHVEPVGEGWIATREVWRCTPRAIVLPSYRFTPRAGAGGASKAFLYSDGLRMDAIQSILGVRPVPGSLNGTTDTPFHWDRAYYRAQLADVADRGEGLDGAWMPRWCRFYPLRHGWAMRFEGDDYPDTFVELIADRLLREERLVILD